MDVVEEVAPGVHRLGFNIGTKPMALYLLAGDHLTLIDTGLQDSPEAVYLPAIRAIGRRPDEVRLVAITHADADHIGGNAAARRHFPNASFACHEADRRWVSDPAVLTEERYDAFGPFGLRYDPAVFAMLAGWMGPAEPMDLLVRGGERIRLRDDEWLSLLHLPGHTPGHLALHHPERRYALVGDAVLGRSQLDINGGWSAPPPYTSVDAYRGTIDALAELDLDLLLTCHYPVLRGADVGAFLDASRTFVDLAQAATRRLLHQAAQPLTLGEAIDRADPLLGPFAFPRDLQFALRAHLDQAVELGEATRVQQNGVVAWSGNRRSTATR